MQIIVTILHVNILQTKNTKLGEMTIKWAYSLRCIDKARNNQNTGKECNLLK